MTDKLRLMELDTRCAELLGRVFTERGRRELHRYSLKRALVRVDKTFTDLPMRSDR